MTKEVSDINGLLTDGRLVLMTPVDPVFLLLPILIRTQSVSLVSESGSELPLEFHVTAQWFIWSIQTCR